MQDQELQDAQLDESSPSQQPETPAIEEQPEAAAPEVEAAPKEVPFHEHPRFREVIEQKNKFADELRQSQLAMAKMQAQLEMLHKSSHKSEAPQEAPIFQKLDGIDPEFAKVMREMYSNASSVKQLQQDLQELREFRQAQEQEKQYTAAMNEISRLHGEYKTPKEFQDFITSRIKELANENPNMSLKDLPEIYKNLHAPLNTFLESQRRQNLASYAQDKTKDAKAPATLPKGKAPGTQKQQYSSDPQEARSQLVANVLKQARASKDF